MHYLARLAVIGIVASVARDAQAQTCLGAASFGAGPVRIGAGLAASDNVKSYGVDMAVGAAIGPFASAGVSRVEYDGVDDAGTGVGIQAGYAIDMTPTKNIQFCPVAAFEYQSGPDIGPVSLSAHAVSFGGSVGGRVAASTTVDFIPFAGVSYVITKVSGSLGRASQSESEDFAALDLGGGFIVNRTLTLRPSVSIPVGLDDSDATFRLEFGFNFGSTTRRR